MSTFPTVEQINELPATSRRVVPDEFIDPNGHMNIQHYLTLGGSALWQRCIDELGMPEDYIATRGMSTFTAEHHLRYLSEVLAGEEVTVHVALVDRGAKSAHAAALIVNQTRGVLACVVETALVHMDMTTRRPCPFPDDVAALMDAAIESDRRGWPLPLSGSIGTSKR